MKDKIGVITGRFQGLHLGHMEYLLAGAARCEHLIVGITNYAPWEEKPEELQHLSRMTRRSNPFTFYERMVMLRDSLVEAGLPRATFDIVPFASAAVGLAKDGPGVANHLFYHGHLVAQAMTPGSPLQLL